MHLLCCCFVPSEKTLKNIGFWASREPSLLAQELMFCVAVAHNKGKSMRIFGFLKIDAMKVDIVGICEGVFRSFMYFLRVIYVFGRVGL